VSRNGKMYESIIIVKSVGYKSSKRYSKQR